MLMHLPLMTPQDLLLIGFLVFLEGILSVDNALVLALLAKPLPRDQHRKALTYGLVGATVFRLGALLLASRLLAWSWVKYVGGGYLIATAVWHLTRSKTPNPKAKGRLPRGFWRTVLAIELMDVAFAVDSILAAIALTPKLWVVFTGTFLGVILVRFLAHQMIRVLALFPHLEATAYQLVATIGVKVIAEGLGWAHPEAFWGLMGASVGYGILRRSPRSQF